MSTVWAECSFPLSLDKIKANYTYMYSVLSHCLLLAFLGKIVDESLDLDLAIAANADPKVSAPCKNADLHIFEETVTSKSVSMLCEVDVHIMQLGG